MVIVVYISTHTRRSWFPVVDGELTGIALFYMQISSRMNNNDSGAVPPPG